MDYGLDKYLASFGFRADLLIDVGVNEGTPWLYSAFPHAEFLLVDPMRDLETILKTKPQNYRIVQAALGQRPDILTFTQQGGRSTLHEANIFDDVDDLYGPSAPERQKSIYEVEVITLDDLLADDNRRFGLKIDAEGHELEILRGGRQALANCEFVVLETSIIQRFVDGSLVSEIFSELAESNFEFYNFLNTWRERPKFYDMIFLPRKNNIVGITFSDDHPLHTVTLAEKSLKSGDLDRAKDLALNAVEKSNRSLPSLIMLARIFLRQKNPADTAELMREAERSAPYNHEVQHLLSSACRQIGNLEGAMIAARKAYELRPTNTTYAYGYGKLLLASGDADKAFVVFSSAAKNKTNDIRIYKELVKIAKSRNMAVHELEFYKIAAKKFPGDPNFSV